MIRVIVVNRHHNPSGSNVVNVQRGTIWGNPFKMFGEHSNQSNSGGDLHDRDAVVDAHAIHFRRQIEIDADFRRRTLALLDLAVDGWLMLECSCAPKRCHADVIAKWLNEQISSSAAAR